MCATRSIEHLQTEGDYSEVREGGARDGDGAQAPHPTSTAFRQKVWRLASSGYVKIAALVAASSNPRVGDSESGNRF